MGFPPVFGGAKEKGAAFPKPKDERLDPTVMPTTEGFFGEYGGAFLPPPLVPIIDEIKAKYLELKEDPSFWAELRLLEKHFTGRPSPILHCERLSEKVGGAQIYLKREDLNHTGAHKINHCLGEALLAKKMGKKKLIAETGAGQHGVALATAAALVGLECDIYMGEVDMAKERPNVVRMKILGANVIPATHGLKTLKEAVDSAFGAYMEDPVTQFYAIGSVVGPHPFPMMVRDFQCVIGDETKVQMQEAEGRLPDSLVASIGGGSNAMGLFHPFLDDDSVRIIGVEAAGHGIETGEHCASLNGGKPGVLHGNRTYLLQNDDGQILDGYSISAGLDYPGIGPEHSWLRDIGRVEYVSITDKEALEAFQLCTAMEGIIPALEPCHALAHVGKIAPDLPSDHLLVMNMCGRGDKDIFAVADMLGFDL